MSRWPPLSRDEIDAELASAVASLHRLHANLFAKIRVPPRMVPVAAHPGESVWVVAHHDGKFVYYSDVEGGWAIARSDLADGIPDRDCSQMDLSHVMRQLFGDPGLG